MVIKTSKTLIIIGDQRKSKTEWKSEWQIISEGI